MKCPYCLGSAVLIDSKEIYGRSYGMAYQCKPCKAYVGCHRGTEKPLGRLANAELRRYKQRAHKAFDPIWKLNPMAGTKRDQPNRKEAYLWLAGKLGIRLKDCHIGMFDVKQCKLVITYCKEAITL
jgi:hypothetical protein